MLPQILVSTPDLRPSLLSVLRGMADTGVLARVATTVALSKRQVEAIAKVPLVGSQLASVVSRREVPEFLTGKVDQIWSRELLRNLTSRLASPIAAHVVWEWAEKSFDRVVSERYRAKFHVVYGMEHSSAETFSVQKESHGVCILRQVSAHACTINSILRREAARFPELVTPYHRALLKSDERIASRKVREYDLADLIIANSTYVKRTFLEHGVPAERIISIPTGCPPSDEVGSRSGRGSAPLRFLYVGTASLRKGFPYLVEAWRLANVGMHAELWIAGSSEIDVKAICGVDTSIVYLGALSRDRLAEVYRGADVLVLPTLCEGLAHSILEGLSFGLPIITTEESGASEFITEEENGTIVPSANAPSLAESIVNLVGRRSNLPAMGLRSMERARMWTREKSNSEHLKQLRKFSEMRD